MYFKKQLATKYLFASCLQINQSL
ncbi:hypothetical protein BN1200_540025 [Klebsiella variicola]|nr:hypothetical protein BN1200_1070004 [Klebsiella variicola]CTQ15341.1 hypothetical protein BN1200_540025 [Klebsiella variicola]